MCINYGVDAGARDDTNFQNETDSDGRSHV